MVCSFAKDKNFCHMHQLELVYLKLPIYYTPPPTPHPLVSLLVFTSPGLIIGCLQYLFIVVQIQGQTRRECIIPFSENAFAYRVVSVLSVHVLHSFFQLLVLHMKPWLRSYVVWDLKETR